MKNEIIKYTTQELEKTCLEYKLDVTVNYSNKSFPSFTIKINNDYSKKFSLSLANNIIDINEESFYAISVCKKNKITVFSFQGKKGKELTFFTNLLNFVKIIKLNHLYNCDINTLEELISVKMIHVANNHVITYIISEKILKFNNQSFNLKNGIQKLSELQNINRTFCNFNIQNFCKSAKVTSDDLENIEKLLTN